MATLHGNVRDNRTLHLVKACITISPCEATSRTDNSRYSVAYGAAGKDLVSFDIDMHNWQFNHSNFERIANAFERVDVLSEWKKETGYQMQPALVESVDWLHFVLVCAKDIVVTLFVTPTLANDPSQDQYSRFVMTTSPEAARTFGETLRKEVAEARSRRIAHGLGTQEDQEILSPRNTSQGRLPVDA